ncbi:hypothetical protein MMC20_002419 [Loxospora ochrophaea]|nr:hypothetical protein [Loxospora ochrophaea]
MSSPTTSPFLRLWQRWKALKLPWRRRWLAGTDLSGTTFWEFRDSNASQRYRRIAQPPTLTHFADIKISPQWHQWLRHTRLSPPSLAEQSADLTRQAQLKQLAALADQRWAEKPSFLDRPEETRQRGPGTVPRDKGGYVEGREVDSSGGGVMSAVGGSVEGSVRAGDEGEGGIDKMGRAEKEGEADVNGRRQSSPTSEKGNEERENPWKVRRGAPGEEWQPAAWTPGATRRS